MDVDLILSSSFFQIGFNLVKLESVSRSDLLACLLPHLRITSDQAVIPFRDLALLHQFHDLILDLLVAGQDEQATCIAIQAMAQDQTRILEV